MENSTILGGPVRYWRGEGPLWAAFWVFGVAVNLTIAAAIYFVTNIGTLNSAVAQGLIALFVAHTVWAVVTVWRCAPNTEHPPFGQIARALTVAWALNVLMVLVFLEADLTGLTL